MNKNRSSLAAIAQNVCGKTKEITRAKTGNTVNGGKKDRLREEKKGRGCVCVYVVFAYWCVCVQVCACAWKSEGRRREKETERKSENVGRERETEREGSECIHAPTASAKNSRMLGSHALAQC